MRLYDPPPLTGEINNCHENESTNGKRYPLPYDLPNLYYRVDDQQSILSSGEAVIKGMFGDLLPPSPQGGGGGVGGGRTEQYSSSPHDVPYR